MSVFNKINDNLIVYTIKNVFQRRSSELKTGYLKKSNHQQLFQPYLLERPSLYALSGNNLLINSLLIFKTTEFSEQRHFLAKAMTKTSNKPSLVFVRVFFSKRINDDNDDDEIHLR